MLDSSEILPISEAPRIASYSIQPPGPTGQFIEIAQAQHRIRMINKWQIVPSSKVLEIGCGQGNTTAVLAEAVGSTGHVDAIDPAPPNYGAPFTLAQAQQHLSNSRIGSRITWHQSAPEDFLLASTKTWDVAVLAHCIWYFPSKSTLLRILHSLRGKVHRICIAEYALHASETAAMPHVLAALARGMLESHKAVSDENIRSPLSPRQIVEVAAEAGWVVGGKESDILVPEAGLLDGHWEVGTVVSKGFVDEIEELHVDERVRDLLRSARDSAVSAVEALCGDKIRTMDVWVGALVPASE